MKKRAQKVFISLVAARKLRNPLGLRGTGGSGGPGDLGGLGSPVGLGGQGVREVLEVCEFVSKSDHPVIILASLNSPITN